MGPHRTALLIKQTYTTSFPPDILINDAFQIICDIVDETTPDNTSLGLFTAGEVRKVEGFYGTERLIREVVQVVVARAIKQSFTLNSLQPTESIHMSKFLEQVQKEVIPLIPQVKRRLYHKYGQPDVVEHDKIGELCARTYSTVMSGF